MEEDSPVQLSGSNSKDRDSPGQHDPEPRDTPPEPHEHAKPFAATEDQGGQVHPLNTAQDTKSGLPHQLNSDVPLDLHLAVRDILHDYSKDASSLEPGTTIPFSLDKLISEVQSQSSLGFQSLDRTTVTELRCFLTNTRQFCDSYSQRMTVNFSSSEAELRPLMRKAGKKGQKALIRGSDAELKLANRELAKVDTLRRLVDSKLHLLEGWKKDAGCCYSSCQMPADDGSSEGDGSFHLNLKRCLLLSMVVFFAVSTVLWKSIWHY